MVLRLTKHAPVTKDGHFWNHFSMSSLVISTSPTVYIKSEGMGAEESEEKPQLVKRLLHKHDDQRLIPRTHWLASLA